MAITTTNIDELIVHLRKVFSNMLKTETFARKAITISDILQREVLGNLDSGEHDYLQSGNLKHLIETTDSGWSATSTRAKVGFASLDDMSHAKFAKRHAQVATFFGGTDYEKNITFGSEPSLPTWIIAEFGRKAGSGVSSSGIPKKFLVPYAVRDQDKEFMVGPSDSVHYRKYAYFMASKKKVQSIFPSEPIDSLRRHPGIRAGQIFNDALLVSQDKIKEIFGNAMVESLSELAILNGNRGGVRL